MPRSLLASLLSTLLLIATSFAVNAASPSPPGLQAAIDSPSRATADRARDPYRHPLQTLSFFGLKPDMTVVEIWPGAGWYTDILAPYLRDHGHYIAATQAASLPDASAGTKKAVADYAAKLAADPARFDKVLLSEFRPPLRTDIAPPDSADLVLTFRNVHNWIAAGFEQAAFDSFFRALKHGGTLGVVEHRAKPGTTMDVVKSSGYVNEAYVKTLAENAGFKFVAESPINNNPRDTKDYAEGVWTLPPTLTLGDKDRDKYLAIGESDRMTLKFVKP